MTISITRRVARIILGTLACFGILLLGVGIGSYPTEKDTPKILQCPYPTEDSCHPDHIGKGRWILIEDQP